MSAEQLVRLFYDGSVTRSSVRRSTRRSRSEGRSRARNGSREVDVEVRPDQRDREQRPAVAAEGLRELNVYERSRRLQAVGPADVHRHESAGRRPEIEQLGRISLCGDRLGNRRLRIPRVVQEDGDRQSQAGLVLNPHTVQARRGHRYRCA
jgi:hypothetical protein